MSRILESQKHNHAVLRTRTSKAEHMIRIECVHYVASHNEYMLSMCRPQYARRTTCSKMIWDLVLAGELAENAAGPPKIGHGFGK